MTPLAAAVLAGAFFAADGAAAQSAPGRGDLDMRRIEQAGVSRSYGVYAPPSRDAARPAPLIVALHGRFSSAKAFHALSHLARAADARGAILLYPETTGGFWNAGGHAVFRWRETPADDAGFIRAAIAETMAGARRGPARGRRGGADAGGDMAVELVCKGALRPAALAVVSALLWSYTAEGCAAPPTSTLIVHGRADDVLPVAGRAYEEQKVRRFGVADTLAHWRAAAGCGEAPSERGGDGSQVYAGCTGGTQVAYVGVARGGHAWFRSGAGYRLNRLDVDAAAIVERFLFDPAFALQRARPTDLQARDYLVYAPPQYRPDTPTPVVVMLHGRPSNASAMALISQMNAVALRHGFIVVYPEGLDNQWNTHFDLVRKKGSILAQQLPQDDVAFLKALMQDLRLDLNIDPQRLYVSGFSNGGFMTLRMACSGADTFAAFATVGGAALYRDMTDECQRGPRTPLLLMHGTADPSIKYTGVEITDRQRDEPVRITLGVQETVAFFAQKNGCSLRGMSTKIAEKGGSPGTHVIRFAPNACDAAAPVLFYLINGGGHTWPGVPGMLEESQFGPLNMDINAGEAIWDFFKDKRLAPPAGR